MVNLEEFNLPPNSTFLTKNLGTHLSFAEISLLSHLFNPRLLIYIFDNG